MDNVSKHLNRDGRKLEFLKNSHFSTLSPIFARILITLILRIGGNLRKYRFRQKKKCFFHQPICRIPNRDIIYLTVFSSSRPTHYHTTTLHNCIYQSYKRQDNLKILLRCSMELCKDECCRKFNWNCTVNAPAKSWIVNIKDFITISKLNPVTHMWFSKLRERVLLRLKKPSCLGSITLIKIVTRPGQI